MEHTFWEDGGEVVLPSMRMADIRNAIEAGLREQLSSRQVAQLDNGRRFERPSIYVHATIISLTPDISIASLAEIPFDSTEVPFSDWPWSALSHDDPHDRRAFNTEYFGCYGGNLSIWVGTLVPYTEDMVVISVNAGEPIQKVQFMNGGSCVVVDRAVITLTRDGADVHVEVHYR